MAGPRGAGCDEMPGKRRTREENTIIEFYQRAALFHILCEFARRFLNLVKTEIRNLNGAESR